MKVKFEDMKENEPSKKTQTENKKKKNLRFQTNSSVVSLTKRLQDMKEKS